MPSCGRAVRRYLILLPDIRVIADQEVVDFPGARIGSRGGIVDGRSTETLIVIPVAAGHLGFGPNRRVAASEEDLLATVLVIADGDVANDDSTEREPVTPIAAGGLVFCPDRAVIAAHVNLHTSISVCARPDKAMRDEPAESLPGRPATTWRRLVRGPHRAITASSEQFQAPVGIGAHIRVVNQEPSQRLEGGGRGPGVGRGGALSTAVPGLGNREERACGSEGRVDHRGARDPQGVDVSAA